MASLINRNGTFYGQWHDANRKPARRRHTLKTPDKKTAHRLLSDADNAYRLGEWDPWVDPISVLDSREAEPIKVLAAVEAYLRDRAGRLQPVTLRNYRSQLCRFAKSAGGEVPLARLQPSDVERYACSGDVKAVTQQTRLITLRSFFSWAVREGHLKENTARRVETPTAPARLPRVVKSEDLEVILGAIRADQERRDASEDQRLHTDRLWLIPCYRFAFLTGLRASELSRMVWEDVDLEKRRLRLEIQKNKRAQYLPLSRKAASVLENIERWGPADFVFCPPESRGKSRLIRAFSTNLNKYFRSYVKAAGIERRLTLHGLRHGFCTKLAEAGANAFTIQAAARHESVKTSQVYVSISGDVLRDSLDSVFG